jgi:hypothetical protein
MLDTSVLFQEIIEGIISAYHSLRVQCDDSVERLGISHIWAHHLDESRDLGYLREEYSDHSILLSRQSLTEHEICDHVDQERDEEQDQEQKKERIHGNMIFAMLLFANFLCFSIIAS